MADVINVTNLIAQINALKLDGEFTQNDVNYLINYIIANGDMTGSPRDLIQIRRGNLVNLPTLAQGELAVTLDTEEMFFGGENGNVVLPTQANYSALLNDVLQRGINVMSSPYNAIADGVTINTATIQDAIDDIVAGAIGGKVFIPDNVKFVLKDLSFLGKVDLIFRAGDGGLVGIGGSEVTREWVHFSNNSNAGGAVNEFVFMSPFNPAFVIDNQKEITTQVGAGQSQLYGRGTLLYADEGISRYGLIYDGDYGLHLDYFEMRQTLTNIKIASFTTPPAVGAEVTGSVSGARGVVVLLDTVNMIVRQIAGTFIVGDHIIDSNETSIHAATVVANATVNRTFKLLCDIRNGGNMAFGGRNVAPTPNEFANQLTVVANSPFNSSAQANGKLGVKNETAGDSRAWVLINDSGSTYFYLENNAASNYVGRVGDNGYEVKTGSAYYPSMAYLGHGTTAARPSGAQQRHGVYYDTTLAAWGMPTFYNPIINGWVKYDGTLV